MKTLIKIIVGLAVLIISYFTGYSMFWGFMVGYMAGTVFFDVFPGNSSCVDDYYDNDDIIDWIEVLNDVAKTSHSTTSEQAEIKIAELMKKIK